MTVCEYLILLCCITMFTFFQLVWFIILLLKFIFENSTLKKTPHIKYYKWQFKVYVKLIWFRFKESVFVIIN